MLSVIRVHLPSEVPIVGCELTPYVLLRRPDNTATTDDVPESSPLDGHFLKYRCAYSSFARMGGSLTAEQQRRRMDPASNEPLFTNCTRDFIGTLDYIFYTADTLTVESLLELLDEESLRKDTALPSPEWSSDHIALLAEFRCMPKTRR
ncbi:hypothetical protein F2Q70_00044089 [Brassica cretica]|uniref:Endonuclease/exonuclease/phosphatase domain-containing protein n=1 Tax=Brassica cretica TaxID=69181 RepID=A0A8S9KLS1_BRACR|nr:hypothetical protein F2Q70_00044089 [Brassica cretica]